MYRRIRLDQGPLLEQELRAWLGRPAAYHPLDFLGVALGSYFLWQSWRHGRAAGAGLGALMIAIHGVRFFYAPHNPAQLRRVVEAAGLRWEDVCPR